MIEKVVVIQWRIATKISCKKYSNSEKNRIEKLKLQNITKHITGGKQRRDQ